MGYFRMLAAIPGFFLSSLFFMLLWGPISSRLGWPDIDYVDSMLIVVTLWIALAPLASVGSGKKSWNKPCWDKPANKPADKS